MERSTRTAQRGDLAFAIYLGLAPRSLAGLARHLEDLGVPISLGTLKRWSTRFHWQVRAQAIDDAALPSRDGEATARLLAMADRHAQLGRGLLSAGGTALQRLLSDDPRLGTLKATEITRLLDLGLRAEREATQTASDRTSITIEVWNSAITTVGALFTQCNTETDAGTRAQHFATGLDALVDTHLAAVAVQG